MQKTLVLDSGVELAILCQAVSFNSVKRLPLQNDLARVYSTGLLLFSSSESRYLGNRFNLEAATFDVLLMQNPLSYCAILLLRAPRILRVFIGYLCTKILLAAIAVL